MTIIQTLASAPGTHAPWLCLQIFPLHSFSNTISTSFIPFQFLPIADCWNIWLLGFACLVDKTLSGVGREGFEKTLADTFFGVSWSVFYPQIILLASPLPDSSVTQTCRDVPMWFCKLDRILHTFLCKWKHPKEDRLKMFGAWNLSDLTLSLGPSTSYFLGMWPLAYCTNTLVINFLNSSTVTSK